MCAPSSGALLLFQPMEELEGGGNTYGNSPNAATSGRKHERFEYATKEHRVAGEYVSSRAHWPDY
jgi:hypothetical protein